MKKIILMAVALLGLSTAMMAQENTSRHFKKGYSADVQLSVSATNTFHFASSHGYAFGNGLYLGGGAGFGAEWAKGGNLTGEPHYVPSLFLNARWSMLNRSVSPYVDVKATQYIDLAEGATNYGVTPTVGIDLGRFSLGVGYNLRTADHNGIQLAFGFTF